MIANVTGDPAPAVAASVPTAEISFNPDNPRDEIGDVSDLVASIAEVGQIVAITIATVEAYLSNRPERQSDLDDGVKYVVIDGNRRLEAARQAGLPSIKVMLGDEFATTDESLLEAAFIANANRKGLSELEEAHALKRLVDFYGSQHKAAKRLSMSQPLISQKLSLLALTPALQADLEAGRRQVSHVRGMTKIAPEKQLEEADRRAQADAAKKRHAAAQKQEAPRTPLTDNSVITQPTDPSPPVPVRGTDNSVITEPASDPHTDPPEGDNSVITPRASTEDDTASTAGESAAAQSASASVTSTLPWGNPQALNRILRDHLAAEDRLTLAKLLAE
ncbi:ParB/RepB/Spo0J family partition protein [Streptomyces mirabilis]|uniref:ParB/RepB/Spo0J family partition protein n=1 Tax=Streptomyces mirabilis TaxID=68239 RepID=UPI0036942857